MVIFHSFLYVYQAGYHPDPRCTLSSASSWRRFSLAICSWRRQRRQAPEEMGKMSGKCGENAGKMRKCQENNGKNMGKTIICNYGKKTTEMWNGKINIMCGKHQDKKEMWKWCWGILGQQEMSGQISDWWKIWKNMLYLINSMHCFSCTCLSISQYMKVYHTWNHMCPYVVCTKLKDSRLWSWSKRHISGGWKTRKSHCPISWDARCPQTWCECCWKKTWILYIVNIVNIVTIVTIVLSCVCVTP